MTTEAKVGAFVLSCFAVLAFTIIYLLNAQYSGGTVQYRTYLRYAGGLEPGASVLYGGMNVGKVTAVRPWATDPTRIEILLEVKKDTPLNEKSVAKLGFVSVMNSAALSITTGTIDAKRLPPDSTVRSQEAASLDEIAGKLATVADSANTLITQAQGELNDISGNMNHLLANLDTMTGPQNQKKVQAILDNIDRLVADERPKIARLTDQLAKVSEHADDTIQNVNGTVTDLRAPMRKDLAELQTTLEEAKGLLQSVQMIVRANDYKINDTVENLREATDNLNQFTNSLKQRPWSLVRVKQPEDRQFQRFRNRSGGENRHEETSKRARINAGDRSRPDRLRREAKISGLLHAQFAGSAGSARCGKRPNLNRGTRIPIAGLSTARADRLPEDAGGNRLLRISPLGGRSAHAFD